MPSSTSVSASASASAAAAATASTTEIVVQLSSTRQKTIKIPSTIATRTPPPPSKSKTSKATTKKPAKNSKMLTISNSSNTPPSSSSSTRRPPIRRRSGSNKYFVESIVGIRMMTVRQRDGQRVAKPYFKVKWWDWPMSECTWEPYRNLGPKCDSYIEEFKRKQAAKKRKKEATLKKAKEAKKVTVVKT